MQYKKIPGVDKPVAQVVQGTMMINLTDLDYSYNLLDAVFAAGGTTFDTAHGYAGGDSERTLGRWMKERGIRDQVVVLTKGAHHNRDRQRVTPFDITSDLHDSLARLQTDYIDLYLLHRDNPDVPVGPIVEILNEHHRAGLIRVFGGSNWTKERIQAANAYAAANGLVPFAASSPNYSLADQKKEPWANCVTISGPGQQAARDWYAETQMPLFTWSSLASGFFSGRFRRGNLDGFDYYMDRVCVESYCAEDNFQRLDRAEELAAEKEVSLPQIALAFVLNQPLNVFSLVGSRTPEEFQTNVAAAEVSLTQTELDWLDLKRETR